jgi:hypothetical protein
VTDCKLYQISSSHGGEYEVQKRWAEADHIQIHIVIRNVVVDLPTSTREDTVGYSMLNNEAVFTHRIITNQKFSQIIRGIYSMSHSKQCVLLRNLSFERNVRTKNVINGRTIVTALSAVIIHIKSAYAWTASITRLFLLFMMNLFLFVSENILVTAFGPSMSYAMPSLFTVWWTGYVLYTEKATIVIVVICMLCENRQHLRTLAGTYLDLRKEKLEDVRDNLSFGFSRH